DASTPGDAASETAYEGTDDASTNDTGPAAPDATVATDAGAERDTDTGAGDAAPPPDVPPPPDCRTAGCPGLTYCDLATGTCRPGCIRDEQCTGASERCDTATRSCVCTAAHHRCAGVCRADDAVATCGASCTPCPTAP